MGNQPTIQTVYSYERTDRPQKRGYSKEMVSVKNKDNQDALVPKDFKGCKTIWECFQKTVEKYGDENFLGTRQEDAEGRPYQWKTYADVEILSCYLAKGIQKLKFQKTVPYHHEEGFPHIDEPQTHLNFVGIYAKNREEWVVTDLALMRSSITIIPFFESLGTDALAFVLKQTQLTTMFCDKASIKNILKAKEKSPDEVILKNIVSFDSNLSDLTQDQLDLIKRYEINLMKYDDVLEEGRAAHLSSDSITLNPPSPSTMYIFTYTSGTTGDPKAAMITHDGVLPILHCFEYVFPHFGKDDVEISYLPYAHIMEQCCFILCMANGAKIGFYSGSPLKLFDDMQSLRPTLFITVPRILSKVYQKIQEDLEKKFFLQRWLFNRALSVKRGYFESGGYLSHKLYDKLIFDRVKDYFGGQIRLMITASAPISPDVLTFFKVALGINIHEVYGQTETVGPATATFMDDIRLGHVGGIMPSLRMRTMDIPEMEYSCNDEEGIRGELQFQGLNIFKGYYKNKEKTLEAFEYDTEEDRRLGRNAWIKTGDIGRIDRETGTVKIFDRSKNIFKLSQGEYIAPEKLENIYQQANGILQIFVYGDSHEAYLVGVVVPSDELKNDFKTKHPAIENDEQLASNKDFKKQIIETLDRKAREAQCSSLEKIKKIHISVNPFTIENDLITPTYKLKRNNVKKFFEKELKAMYAEGEGTQ